MNNINEKITAIVYSKKDVANLIKINSKINQILPLTANALDKLKESNLDYLILSNKNLKLILLKIISKSKKITNMLFNHIENNITLSIATKETLKSLLPQVISAALYIHYSSKNYKTWAVYDGKNWIKTDKMEKLIEIIFTKSSQGVFGGKNNPNQKFKFIISIINKIIFYKNRNTNSIWITGNSEKFKNIFQKIKDKNSNITVFKFIDPNTFSLIKSFVTLFFNIWPFGKQKIINLVPIINKVEYDYDAVKDIIYESLPEDIKNLSEVIFNNIDKCIENTIAIEKYSNYIFNNKKIKLIIAHELRWLGSVGIASAANTRNIPVYLISHNTHSITNNRASDYVQLINGYGLIYSKLASHLIIQSPSAQSFINKNYKSVNTINYQPLMWGNNTIKEYEKKNNTSFTILFADTVKNLSMIPYIYETSITYMKNLIAIINSINFSENTKLVIRFRASAEIDLEVLENILNKNKNIQIKTDGNFIEDLKNADLFISHSSTTIEEALYERKPVALIGGNNCYYHLPGTKDYPTKEKRSAVYHLDNNNIRIMLDKIIIHHFSTMLTDNEIKDYVWGTSVPTIDKFVDDLNI